MSAVDINAALMSNQDSQNPTVGYVNSFFKEESMYPFADEIVENSHEQIVNSLETWANDSQTQPRPLSQDVHFPTANIQISITSADSDVAKTSGSSSAFSDTSSDVSDITTSLPISGSSSAYVIPVVEGISEQDVNQIDLFYRSHKTDVKVCRSLANLYISSSKTKGGPTQTEGTRKKSTKNKKSKSSDIQIPIHPDPSDFSNEDWEFSKTGIPLVIIDSGEHVRERSLKIVLAEKGTGFTMWEDELNRFTDYNIPHTNFHTISLSKDTTRLVGFSFDDAKAATEFAETVRSLISGSVEELMNLNMKKQKKEKKSKHKYKPPKKVDISQPVCFVHVTKLQRPDLIYGLFPPPPCGAELDRLGIPRAMSDSSGISECSSTASEH